MYADHPLYSIPANKVLVLEGTETDADQVIQEAVDQGAFYDHPEDGRIFYIVFADTPRRIDPMSERVLRIEIKQQAKKLGE